MGKFLKVILLLLIALSSAPDFSFKNIDQSSNKISLSLDTIPDSTSEKTDSDESSDMEAHKKQVSFIQDAYTKNFSEKVTRHNPKGKLHTFVESYTKSFIIPPSCS